MAHGEESAAPRISFELSSDDGSDLPQNRRAIRGEASAKLIPPAARESGDEDDSDTAATNERRPVSDSRAAGRSSHAEARDWAADSRPSDPSGCRSPPRP